MVQVPAGKLYRRNNVLLRPSPAENSKDRFNLSVTNAIHNIIKVNDRITMRNNQLKFVAYFISLRSMIKCDDAIFVGACIVFEARLADSRGRRLI